MEATATPRIDFYDGGSRHADTLAVAVALVCKAAAAGQRPLILAVDADQASRLDERLWDVQPASTFVPHAMADDPHCNAAQVVIATPAHAVSGFGLVVNLRPDAVDLDCARIIELIPADDDGKRLARDRWRAYQARGLTPTKIDLDRR
jgi:DNA polymerase-3 subunit chi